MPFVVFIAAPPIDQLRFMHEWGRAHGLHNRANTVSCADLLVNIEILILKYFLTFSSIGQHFLEIRDVDVPQLLMHPFMKMKIFMQLLKNQIDYIDYTKLNMTWS